MLFAARRGFCKKMEAWADANGELLLNDTRPVYSENGVVRGIEIARQIKRLKQNITNSQSAANRAESQGKKTVMQNALDRVAGYQEELAALEKEIATQQSASKE